MFGPSHFSFSKKRHTTIDHRPTTRKGSGSSSRGPNMQVHVNRVADGMYYSTCFFFLSALTASTTYHYASIEGNPIIAVNGLGALKEVPQSCE